MFGKGFQQKTLTKEVEFQFRVSTLKYLQDGISKFWTKVFDETFQQKGSKLYVFSLLNDGLVCAIWENYKLHGLYVKQPDILTDSI